MPGYLRCVERRPCAFGRRQQRCEHGHDISPQYLSYIDSRSQPNGLAFFFVIPSLSRDGRYHGYYLQSVSAKLRHTARNRDHRHRHRPRRRAAGNRDDRHRLADVDFSNVYYRTGQSLLVKRTSHLRSYRDLAGRSVCTTSGSTSEQTIRRFAPKVTVHTFDTYADCLDALQTGRVDAMTTDDAILLGYQRQDPANLQIVGGMLSFVPYGIGIAKGNTTLLAAVNAALSAMMADGEYARILRRTLGVALPADAAEWFGMDPNKAATEYAAQQH
jgi:hypothetical protein